MPDKVTLSGKKKKKLNLYQFLII